MAAGLSRFKELLLRSCGHLFENEREQALISGLQRRMTERATVSFDAYFSLLLSDSNELARLTELLTVNETYFFREPGHLELMIDTLLPDIMASHNRRPIRILSAGCSTGEEPYSIAIMLRERFGAESEQLFAITGVDIDSTAIGRARQGVYGSMSFRGTDKNLLERYFEIDAQGKYRIQNCIKKQVKFEIVNLLAPSYPATIEIPDIILYRNVSIYFPQQIQREIFSRLAVLLAEGGCLLVSATETFHHDIGILSLVKQKSLFFYQKNPKLVIMDRRSENRNVKVSEHDGSGLSGARPAKIRHDSRRAEPQKITAPPPERRDAKQPVTDIEMVASFDEAVDFARKGLHEKALALLDIIIEHKNAFQKAHCLKGSVLLALSRFDDARNVCETVVSSDPLCLEAYLMLGMIARQNGDDASALKRFREAIYLHSSCWLAHFYTGEILFAGRDVKRARSSFDSALKILESGSLKDHGQAFFPLSFNAEQFIVICRHKLSLLTGNG